MDGIQRKSFGQLLVEKGWVSQAQLKEAQEKQLPGEDLFPGTLVRLGLVAEERGLYPLWADHLNVEYLDLKTFPVDRNVLPRLPATIVTHYKVFPVRYDPAAGILTVATAYPQNIFMLDGLQMVHPGRIKAVLSREADILEAIREYYGVGADTIAKMNDALPGDSNPAGEVEDIEQIDSDASIGKFINQILFEAYRTRATDIHIEPYEQDLKIRCRIDGVLYDTQVPTNIWNFKEAINSRIKIMSNLNIAEKRLPQDGRFKVKVGGMSLDLRVSFLPTQYGESVVIRILSSNRLYNMYELGLNAREQELLEHLIQKPHGIVFVTGPTGSGKTTTLYSCLAHVNTADKKIITIEDPIEYQLNGITQIQINPAIHLTFSQGLRSMLRHDPDIMMVGEVRDQETAEIAIQIALTGHLVFSTLHTNDAASGITRLIDMGVAPYLICSSVECFIAQRLVRVLCPLCKRAVPATEEFLTAVREEFPGARPQTVFEPQGCEACQGTGYRGREGIYEFLLLNDVIREMILSRATAAQITKKAVEQGMKTLLKHGWEKVLDGKTTPGEIIRVTKDDTNF
ncbi:MAG TPA: ATPase, T2SS/T4P/T4SS family [Candidatus Omnitrophota bacterium]|nr:Flp pilus assembly complex ATPase component TadA [Candidatus Omnitrophota bacterium]HQO59107.1 ATPase, T2SS/T4P/T4SS family [Candidatus Omnitrophota bacterium]HQP12065.1 ATPase, T2SS/T4P/T4SS family [Candidatus Omnitrophota bacterium]